jgi:hypothetical protein
MTDFTDEFGCPHCVVRNRKEDEEQREWLKDSMCQYHWMQTDYYQSKLKSPIPISPPKEKEELG